MLRLGSFPRQMLYRTKHLGQNSFMNIRAIGASGGVTAGYKTTCYLIGENLLLDCGAAATGLDLEEQKNITDILVTHPHLDHIKDIAFLIDNTFNPARQKLKLHSSAAILEDIKENFFNNKIWPDFSKIPSQKNVKDSELLVYEAFNDQKSLNQYQVKMVDVNHPGNAVGFLLSNKDTDVLFTGDTGVTDEIWQLGKQAKNLKAVFTEISFPNNMEQLAVASGHYTINLLLKDMQKLGKQTPVYINHFKPQFFQALVEEFHKLAPENWVLLHQNHEINL